MNLSSEGVCEFEGFLSLFIQRGNIAARGCSKFLEQYLNPIAQKNFKQNGGQ